MTITEPTEPSPPPAPRRRVKHKHDVAIWGGVAAFFANIIGLEVVDRISDNDAIQILEGVIVSLVVAGAVYSRERLLDAKRIKDKRKKPAA